MVPSGRRRRRGRRTQRGHRELAAMKLMPQQRNRLKRSRLSRGAACQYPSCKKGLPLTPTLSPSDGEREKTRCVRAFTLVELMVVMVLIAIMAAMIVPEMKGTYEDALLRSS